MDHRTPVAVEFDSSAAERVVVAAQFHSTEAVAGSSSVHPQRQEEHQRRQTDR